MLRASLGLHALSATALLIILLIPMTVSAHEQVPCGSYTCEIGWVNEPVIVGQPNGLSLFVAPQDKPEEGVADISTLEFAVEYGGVKQTYELAPVEERPGAYTANFLPTREGKYTFHLTGTINGEAIDVQVEPEEVVAPGNYAFPEPLPALRDLTTQLAAAQAQIRTAQILAIVGLGLGVIGLGVGAYALVKKK